MHLAGRVNKFLSLSSKMYNYARNHPFSMYVKLSERKVRLSEQFPHILNR